MENITDWTVVEYHHLTQIRLDTAEIFDVAPISESAMLPVKPSGKVLAFLLEPIDHWVGIFLHTSREYHDFVPLRDLSQKVVAIWTFVDVVEDRMLRGNDWWLSYLPTSTDLRNRIEDWRVELHFDHMA